MSDPGLPVMLRAICQEMQMPPPVAEFDFHPKRRWRFDYAWPDLMVALEYEGGTYTGGRHVRGAGFAGDCEKYNAAAALGWIVVRITADLYQRNGYVTQLLTSVLPAGRVRQRRRQAGGGGK
jgi:hypothetical protein